MIAIIELVFITIIFTALITYLGMKLVELFEFYK